MHCTFSSVHSRQKSIVMLQLLTLVGVNIWIGVTFETAWTDLGTFLFDDFVRYEWDYKRLVEMFAWSVNERRRISVLKSQDCPGIAVNMAAYFFHFKNKIKVSVSWFIIFYSTDMQAYECHLSANSTNFYAFSWTKMAFLMYSLFQILSFFFSDKKLSNYVQRYVLQGK